MDSEKPRLLHMSFEERRIEPPSPALKFQRAVPPRWTRFALYGTLALLLVSVAFYAPLLVSKLQQ